MKYSDAIPKVMNHLEILGWKIDKNLKTPTAQRNVKGYTVTFFFNKQSIHFNTSSDGSKDAKNARSLHDDVKFLALTSPAAAEKRLLESVDYFTGLNLLNINPWG